MWRKIGSDIARCHFQSRISARKIWAVPSPLLFYDNSFVSAAHGKKLPVLSPRNGVVFAEIANASEADIDRAVSNARHCFDQTSWPERDPSDRARLLRAVASGIRRRKSEFAWIESMDCGKPLRESVADVEVTTNFQIHKPSDCVEFSYFVSNGFG